MTQRFLPAAVIAVGLGLSSPAPAADISPAWKEVGTWTVRIDRSLGGCFAASAFEDGTGIRVGLYPDGGTAYLMIANDRWRSLRDDRVYPLEVRFDGYGPWYGTAIPMPRQGPGILKVSVDAEWVAYFSISHVMSVRHQARLVARVSLRGSYAAVNEMLACQEALNESASVDDPFAPQD